MNTIYLSISKYGSALITNFINIAALQQSHSEIPLGRKGIPCSKIIITRSATIHSRKPDGQVKSQQPCPLAAEFQIDKIQGHESQINKKKKIKRGNDSTVMPLACAMEILITTADSLDDLPWLDNVDSRRGKPTSVLACQDLLFFAIDLIATRTKNVSPGHLSSSHCRHMLVSWLRRTSGRADHGN